jgi:hypothetical protein
MVQFCEPPEKLRRVPVTASSTVPGLAVGSKVATVPVWIWIEVLPLETR